MLFRKKIQQKKLLSKKLKQKEFNQNLIQNIRKSMAVVVYWLITAGCGPAKGSSIESFWEKASPKITKVSPIALYF